MADFGISKFFEFFRSWKNWSILLSSAGIIIGIIVGIIQSIPAIKGMQQPNIALSVNKVLIKEDSSVIRLDYILFNPDSTIKAQVPFPAEIINLGQRSLASAKIMFSCKALKIESDSGFMVRMLPHVNYTLEGKEMLKIKNYINDKTGYEYLKNTDFELNISPKEIISNLFSLNLLLSDGSRPHDNFELNLDICGLDYEPKHFKIIVSCYSVFQKSDINELIRSMNKTKDPQFIIIPSPSIIAKTESGLEVTIYNIISDESIITYN